MAPLVLLAVLLNGRYAAAEDGAPPRLHAGDGAPGLLSEIRFGAMAHDAGMFGGKEGGADVNGELLFATPVPRRLSDGAPPWLRWLATPRPHVGFMANTAGYTSKGYFGLTWTALLARDVLRAGDGVRGDFLFGGSLNDGAHSTDRRDAKSLGGNLLLHLGAELGYQATPRYSVSVFFDHDSNGGLARRNQSLNTVGLRFGVGL